MFIGNDGWYEGYAPALPSHTNSLESVHAKIKADCKKNDSV